MKKSRPSELKATAQGQAAGKWQSRALVPACLAPQPQLPATQLDIRRQQANVSRPGILLRSSRQEDVFLSDQGEPALGGRKKELRRSQGCEPVAGG